MSKLSGFAVVAALAVGSLIGAATAVAHIHVTADHVVRGGHAVVTFQVPNESTNGSAATQVTITLPNTDSVGTAVVPGWTATFDSAGTSGAYRSVTFTAVPGGGIGAGQFQLFAVSMQLPDTDSVLFPVGQTYSDGTTVHWDQLRLPSGAEPEHPAPVLALTAGPVEPVEHHSNPVPPGPSVTATPALAEPTAKVSPDNTARALAGSALLVAAIGVGVALARRRT